MPRVTTILLVILGGAVLAILALMTLVSPPGQLTLLDAAMGGGKGVARPGSALPFGSHGQALDVWRPAGPVKTRPVVIFFYGGGWAMGSRGAYGFAARALTKQGFVVVVPDYRKVPEVRFPAFVEDGAEAVRWTLDHIADYGGDPKRIALMGHSAGSHILAMLALDQHFLRAAGVPDGTIKAAVGLSGPYDFRIRTSPRAVEAFKNTRERRITQPVSYARADAPPMFLVTSSNDTEVEPRNAISLLNHLHAVGAPVAFHDYAGLTHAGVVMALSVPFRRKAPVLADSAAFLHAHLGE